MKKVLLIIAITFCIFQMVVLASAIDIGVEAIGRPDDFGDAHTVVNKNNPANASGKITSIEIYTSTLHNPLAEVEVATFFVVSGNNLSTRDWENVGTLAENSYHILEVDLDVVAGDYIGIYNCSIERTTGEAGTLWAVLSSDEIPCVNTAFNSYGDVISLYGTGETPAGITWNGIVITKWNGITITTPLNTQ